MEREGWRGEGQMFSGDVEGECGTQTRRARAGEVSLSVANTARIEAVQVATRSLSSLTVTLHCHTKQKPGLIDTKRIAQIVA
eukprot:1322072-Rhodomonas_salina.1